MTENSDSTQQTTVEENTQTPETEVFLQEPPDPNKDYTTELVGEGKKFRSVQDLAYGKVVADRFIEQLKTELSELRKTLREKEIELQSKMKYEDFLDRLENLSKSSTDRGEPRQKSTDDPKLTEEFVEKVLSQREEKRRREENRAAVTAVLKQTFGEFYEQKTQKLMQEQGIPMDMFKDISERSPSAALALVGIRNSGKSDSGAFVPPPRTTVRPPDNQKKNFQYYQRLRKEKGDSWYFSVPVQQEIWKEAQTQGDSFFK